MGANAL